MRYLILCLLFTGCTHFVIDQTERDSAGILRHTRTTGTTFFDSKSELSKLRASTSDKTQSTSIGALNQDASSTGAVQVLRIIVEAAGKAAVP